MAEQNNANILVTGAAGFLGSHLVDRLLADGYTVVGVDNLLTGRLVNLEEAQKSPHFQCVEADVIAPPETYLPEGFVPDLVFHLASPASPPPLPTVAHRNLSGELAWNT